MTLNAPATSSVCSSGAKVQAARKAKKYWEKIWPGQFRFGNFGKATLRGRRSSDRSPFSLPSSLWDRARNRADQATILKSRERTAWLAVGKLGHGRALSKRGITPRATRALPQPACRGS